MDRNKIVFSFIVFILVFSMSFLVTSFMSPDTIDRSLLESPLSFDILGSGIEEDSGQDLSSIRPEEEYPTYSYNKTVERPEELIEFEEKGGYTILEPNVTALVRKGSNDYDLPDYIVRTNSHGLRDQDFSKRKPDNTVRIMVLGDSFTFGWGVNRSDRYTDLLERKLESEYDISVQVINAAVPGWGARDYYRFYQNKGKRYGPDVVVVSFTRNDEISTQKHLDLVSEEGLMEEWETRNLSIEERERLKSVFSDWVEERGPIDGSSPLLEYLNKTRAATESEDTESVFYAIEPLPQDYRISLDDWSNRTGARIVYSSRELRSNRERYIFSYQDQHYNQKGNVLLYQQLYPAVRDSVSSLNNNFY